MIRGSFGVTVAAASQAEIAICGSSLSGGTPAMPAGRLVSLGLAAARSHAKIKDAAVSGPCATAGKVKAMTDTACCTHKMSRTCYLMTVRNSNHRQRKMDSMPPNGVDVLNPFSFKVPHSESTSDIRQRREVSIGVTTTADVADVRRVMLWTAPPRHESAIEVGAVGTSHDSESQGMQTTATVGLDIAKSVFQVHGVEVDRRL